jgi:hypothetical protein
MNLNKATLDRLSSHLQPENVTFQEYNSNFTLMFCVRAKFDLLPWKTDTNGEH